MVDAVILPLCTGVELSDQREHRPYDGVPKVVANVVVELKYTHSFDRPQEQQPLIYVVFKNVT